VAYRSIIPWQVLERKTLVAKRWMTVHEERVRLGNGNEIPDFHLVEAPNWAAVLCVTAEDEVVLVRQYRRGIAAESLELPAGVMDIGEIPLEAAQRELGEETGYTARSWQPVATFATDPSRSTVRAHFFCALGASQTAARALEASEDLEVLKVPRAELLGLVESGRIVHGVHVAAILLAERRGLLKAP
jgi:8-oxo-dGTP pyrophosphatase MutT (NUDIX family)